MRAACCAALIMLSTVVGAAPQHEAYIWQRVWDARVHDAIAQSRAQLNGYRVLVLQRERSGRLVDVRPDWALLAGTGLAVTAVVRIDGSGPEGLDAALIQRIADWLLAQRQAGVTIDALEIDHDCASAQLEGYRNALTALRAALPSNLTLAITALPSWFGAPGLSDLLQSVDAVTLQVHAVDEPARGLFNAARALRWARQWARLPNRPPLTIALPAYWGVYEDGNNSVELPLDVDAVQTFLRDAAADPNLQRIVWFRLPRQNDRRALRWITLAALIRGDRLQADVQLSIDRSDNGGFLLHARNVGNRDGVVPTSITVRGDCRFGDVHGRGGLQRGDGWLRWVTPDVGLAANSARTLGWLRCQPGVSPRLSTAAG